MMHGIGILARCDFKVLQDHFLAWNPVVCSGGLHKGQVGLCCFFVKETHTTGLVFNGRRPMIK